MKHITIMLLLCICEVTLSHYKMDPFITCLEQNDERPYGFKESETWGNPNSIECQENPELCAIYADKNLPFGGEGDVCDHTDPVTGNRRNACKMAVMYGEDIDEEKTWSWKCADLAVCAVRNENDEGIEGCLITEKRIQCCCQDDYCTSQPLFAKYAAFGRPDHFPPNFTAILEIEPGNVTRVVNIGGYNFTEAIRDTDTETGENENNDTVITDNEYEFPEFDIDINEVTIEECLIKEAIPTDCSCGVDCSSVEYEYRATVERKCGDQLLTTGEYGEEACNPFNHIVYEVDVTYPCAVLSCENGEFRITDDAYTIRVGASTLIAVFMIYLLLI